MDQLDRGVQVENLSLLPGITLNKVDPSKSELLRAKSDSIKRLTKPLSSQAPGPHSHTSQPTIIILICLVTAPLIKVVLSWLKCAQLDGSQEAIRLAQNRQIK